MKGLWGNRWAMGVIALLVVISSALVGVTGGTASRSAVADTGPGIANPAMYQVWERTDYPVAMGMVNRSWFWGPTALTTTFEAYDQTPGTYRQVVYLDKSRMEITYPNGNTQSQWYVTNGLLTRELVSGQLQCGDTRFETLSPAQVPVAGDPVQPLAPTYASFRSVASLAMDKRMPNLTGLPVTATINRDGIVGTVGTLPAYVTNTYYDETLGHNVPGVFWAFMNQWGLVYSNDSYHTEQLTDWLYTFGLPITDAYWTRATVGGQPKDVLVQLFERRVLTYTPSNSPEWQVEMGNIGRHYQTWRYQVAARTLSVTPQTVNVGSTITVSGTGWGAYKPIHLALVPRNGDPRFMNTITATLSGTFSFTYTIPTDLPSDNPMHITAWTDDGLPGQQAALTVLTTPSLSTDAVLQGFGGHTVTGANFPANTTVKLGVAPFGTRSVKVWVATTPTNGKGQFSTSFDWTATLMSSFLYQDRVTMVAQSANGQSSATTDVSIECQPHIWADGVATIGSYVTLRGEGYPAQQQIPVYARLDHTNAGIVDYVYTANDGTFLHRIPLPKSWAVYSDVVLTVSMGGGYYRDSVRVSLVGPATLSYSTGVTSTTFSVQGAGWPHKQTVSLSLIDSKGNVLVSLPSVQTDANGDFSTTHPWDAGHMALALSGMGRIQAATPTVRVALPFTPADCDISAFNATYFPLRDVAHDINSGAVDYRTVSGKISNLIFYGGPPFVTFDLTVANTIVYHVRGVPEMLSLDSAIISPRYLTSGLNAGQTVTVIGQLAEATNMLTGDVIRDTPSGTVIAYRGLYGVDELPIAAAADLRAVLNGATISRLGPLSDNGQGGIERGKASKKYVGSPAIETGTMAVAANGTYTISRTSLYVLYNGQIVKAG